MVGLPCREARLIHCPKFPAAWVESKINVRFERCSDARGRLETIGFIHRRSRLILHANSNQTRERTSGGRETINKERRIGMQEPGNQSKRLASKMQHHRHISRPPPSRRTGWRTRLAEGAVMSEPFSAGESLISRENAGNFLDSGRCRPCCAALTTRTDWPF